MSDPTIVELARLDLEIARLRSELAAARPVIEAAKAWRAHGHAIQQDWSRHIDHQDLARAVDALNAVKP